jgi:hypothetical protein
MSNERRNGRNVWDKLFAFMRQRNNGILNLRDANLRDADLRFANLEGTKIQIPVEITSNNDDVRYVVPSDDNRARYGVGCYEATAPAFIDKTLKVRNSKQAKQIFYRCLSFGNEGDEQLFLDAIEALKEAAW